MQASTPVITDSTFYNIFHKCIKFQFKTAMLFHPSALNWWIEPKSECSVSQQPYSNFQPEFITASIASLH